MNEKEIKRLQSNLICMLRKVILAATWTSEGRAGHAGACVGWWRDARDFSGAGGQHAKKKRAASEQTARDGNFSGSACNQSPKKNTVRQFSAHRFMILPSPFCCILQGMEKAVCEYMYKIGKQVTRSAVSDFITIPAIA